MQFEQRMGFYMSGTSLPQQMAAINSKLQGFIQKELGNLFVVR